MSMIIKKKVPMNVFFSVYKGHIMHFYKYFLGSN